MKWRQITGWTLAVIAALIAIGVVAGYFYLQSSGFRQFAMRKIIEETDQATGGRAQIGGFDFQLSTLTAHLYNVVIRGDEPSNAPPLLQLDKLTVGLKIQSLLHHRINLSELLIEHPVVHLQINREGKSNLPRAPQGQSSSHTNIFDLAVGHLAISHGEIDYNDRKTPLDADLQGLQTDVNFDSLATRYQGSISYQTGSIRYGEYAALPHSFSADFRATPALLSLNSAVLKVASSTVTLHANVTNYSNPAVTGDYDIRVHTPDFAALLASVRTAGDVHLTGQIHYQNADNQPLLRNIQITGQFGSDRLSAASSGGDIEARNLEGKYQLANGSLRASGIAAQLFNGRISADVDVKNLDASPTSRVQATLHTISLPAIQRALRRPELSRVAIVGTLDGSAEASWTGSAKNMRAHSDLTLRAPDSVSNHATTAIPVNGVLHADYDGAKNILALHQTTLRIPSATLSAEGQVSQHSKLDVHAASGDLHQLMVLASAFGTGKATLPLVSGSATLDATVQGATQSPQISGHATAQNLRVQGSEWKTAEVALQASPSHIVVSKATLVNAQRGVASFTANVGLRDWSYLPTNPIQASLSLKQMSVADLQHLANVHYPLSGDLSVNVSVSGSQLNPSGSGSISIANARAYDEPIKTLALNFHAESGSIISKLNVVTDAGSTNTDFTYTPKTQAYKLHLDAPGIVLQKLHTVQAKNLAVNGTVSLSASGEGTFNDPQLTATLQLPQLNVRQKSITGIKADLHVANRTADFTLDSQVAASAVRARGHVNLTGDYETDASLDTAVIPLDLLLAAYATAVPQGFKGQTEFHATLKGPLKDKSKLEAHLTIPTLAASYQSLQIEAAGPIRADYAYSVITLQPAEIRGTDTSIRIQGSIPISGSAAPTLTAEGSIDARIVQIVSPDVRSAGTVALDVRTVASGSGSQVQGQVRLQNISLATAEAPLGVDKLNGTLDLNNDRVQISSLTAEVGGGQVSAGGSLRYRPDLQFNIAMHGDSVRLRYPEGLRSLLDSNLTWTGNLAASTLAGRVLVDGLSFTPGFDLATFGDQVSSNASVPAVPGFADSVSLRIAVQSKDNLNATSSQISLEGSADLNVIGTAANPVITGRTNLSGGELFYRNVRYQLERGIITFDDPNQTNPVLNVSVSTIIEQYNLTLTLRGSFNQLTTSYVSDPPLATADVINLIARGKTSSELAESSDSTDSMLASQAASQLSSSVQKLAGISSLQIDPLLGGNNQNPSARLALQQRLTKNLLFTFSTDVTQPGQEIVQGEYQINKRWSVSLERDQVGGVSVDGRYHTQF
jgi:translocation and assembly module TamB